MTAATLIDATLTRLDQPIDGTGFYSRPEALQAVNTAQRLVCFLSLCLESTASIAIDPSAAIYSHDGIAILRIAQGGVRVERVSLGSLAARDAKWYTAQENDVESYAPISASKFAIYARPFLASSLSVTTARYPAVMSEGSTPEIPEEHHQALADGAAAILAGMKEGGQEQTKAKQWLTSYLDAVVDIADAVRNRSRQYRYDVAPPPLAVDEIIKELMPDGPKRSA